jgi:hypothetical protein
MPQKCTVLYIILLTRILAMKIWTIGSLIILHPVIIFFLRVIRRGAPLAAGEFLGRLPVGSGLCPARGRAGVAGVLTAGRGES